MDNKIEEELLDKYEMRFGQELSLNSIQEVHARQIISDFMDELCQLFEPDKGVMAKQDGSYKEMVERLTPIGGFSQHERELVSLGYKEAQEILDPIIRAEERKRIGEWLEKTKSVVVIAGLEKGRLIYQNEVDALKRGEKIG